MSICGICSTPTSTSTVKDIVGTHEFVNSEHAGMSQMEDDQVQILLDILTFDTAGAVPVGV